MEYVPQVQLNDLDVSGSHLERLVHDLLESPLIGQHFTEIQQAHVKEKLSSLTKLTLRLKSSLRVCFKSAKSIGNIAYSQNSPVSSNSSIKYFGQS